MFWTVNMRTDYSNRLGAAAWQQRLAIEKSPKHRAKNHTLRNPPAWHPYAILHGMLKLSGLMRLAHKQYLSPVVERNAFTLTNLPEALHNFTLLQITDIHADLDPGHLPFLIDTIKIVDYDLCVLTGDFQNAFDATSTAIELLHPVLSTIQKPCFAVPGNHDTIEMIEQLEQAGLPFLLNENVLINHDGATLHLCGIDDPIYFRGHNLVKARQGVAADAVTILLSHVPTTAEDASRLGYDIQLSGHTHGGQLCLPGGIPIAKGSTPRSRASGAWRVGRLQGYTSRGVGASHIPARLFCPPEITLHTLKRIG